MFHWRLRSHRPVSELRQTWIHSCVSATRLFLKVKYLVAERQPPLTTLDGPDLRPGALSCTRTNTSRCCAAALLSSRWTVDVSCRGPQVTSTFLVCLSSKAVNTLIIRAEIKLQVFRVKVQIPVPSLQVCSWEEFTLQENFSRFGPVV